LVVVVRRRWWVVVVVAFGLFCKINQKTLDEQINSTCWTEQTSCSNGVTGTSVENTFYIENTFATSTWWRRRVGRTPKNIENTFFTPENTFLECSHIENTFARGARSTWWRRRLGRIPKNIEDTFFTTENTFSRSTWWRRRVGRTPSWLANAS